MNNNSFKNNLEGPQVEEDMTERAPKTLFKMKNDYYRLEELPPKIPLLMIRGAVILPQAHFSLPVFDSDHGDLLLHCLKNNQLIGLIQPNIPFHKTNDLDHFDLFNIGCLVRVTEIHDHRDTKFVANLEGICRFKLIDQEKDQQAMLQEDVLENFPMATVDYEPFLRDLVCESDFSMDRPRLINALKPYFNDLDIVPNWDEIHRISNHKLIIALSMACPLGAAEKQFILETESMQEQSEVMIKLIEMASLTRHNEVVTYH